MKPAARQPSKRAAFTIIELLTVMSVIIILIGLLVPALNMVKRFAKKVTQKNQFHTMEVAMETFNAEREEYPPSDYIMRPPTPGNYCGAMKLCEAMVGQDLLGFDPQSRFVYPDAAYDTLINPDLSDRRAYLKSDNANVYKLKDLYPASHLRYLEPEAFVLCDVYATVTHLDNGKLVGMPVLYYRANTSNTGHSYGYALTGEAIFDVGDNHTLVGLGIPSEPPPPPTGTGPSHDLHASPEVFYERTRNDKIDIDGDGVGDRPYKADSYILLSAGWDGKYGTDDDVYNFGL